MRWWLAAVACVACGGKLPETRYYQLAAHAQAAPAGGQAVLAIEPLAADPAYDDERIVYRTTPYRLDYYHYHRWSALPGVMIAGYLEQALENTGQFRAVVRAPSDTATLVLGGRVVAIEEVDAAKNRWVGRIALELVVSDPRTNASLWTRRIEETEPLRVQSPEGLAEALSAAMARVTARIGPEVAGVTRPKK